MRSVPDLEELLLVLRVVDACLPVGCQLFENIDGTSVWLVEQRQHDWIVRQVRHHTQLYLLKI